MKSTLVVGLFACITLLFAGSASAADYKCKNGHVTKSGSTKFTYKSSGSDITVLKSGSTKGKARKSGSKWSVTVSGSTKARFDDRKIYKSGSSWSTISDAQRVFDCPGPVAATLWILMELRVL